MDSVLEGVTIADFSLPDQPLIYANHGFEEITGYSIEETVGHNCRFLQGPKTEPEKLMHIRKCISAGLPCTVQIKNYRKTGEEFINYLSLTPIRTAKGQVTHYVGIQSDITELVNTRTAELDALKKATIAEAATDAKSKFLAHMSHEIRTPLNGLIAVGAIGGHLAEPHAEGLRLHDSVFGGNLAGAHRGHLGFLSGGGGQARASQGGVQPQAVIATVIKIVGLHSARLRLNIGYHLDENVPELVIGDAMRVQQVLLNTINNAIKFTEKGDIMIRMYVGKRRHAEESFARANKAASESDEAEDKEPTTREWREEATRIGMKEAQERATLADWLERPKSVAMDDASTSSGDAEDERGRHGASLLREGHRDRSEQFQHFHHLQLVPASGSVADAQVRRHGARSGDQPAPVRGDGRAHVGRVPGLGMGARSTSASGASRLPWSVGRGGGARARRRAGCPIEAKKEAAILAVRASGATTNTVKSMVRTPSTMNFNTICNGRELRVLLFDESKMMRQTLSAAIERWGVSVTQASTSKEIVAALDAGVSCDAKEAPYDVVVAEKSKTFVDAIRRWAESRKQISPRGGAPSRAAGERAGGRRRRSRDA